MQFAFNHNAISLKNAIKFIKKLYMRGLQIKEFREKFIQLTQKEFSILLGISLRTMHNWENEEEVNERAIKKLKNNFITIVGKGEEMGDNSYGNQLSYYDAIIYNTSSKRKEDHYKKREKFKSIVTKNSNNTAGRDNIVGNQNFLNEPKEDYLSKTEIENKELREEVKRLNKELNACKDKIINLLTTK